MSVAFSIKAEMLGKDTRIVAIGIFFNGSREQFDDAGRVATQFCTDARDCGLMICDSAEIPMYLCCSKVTHLPLNIGQSEAAHRRPEG